MENVLAGNGQTPPCKQGGKHGKQAHSPWSAPRERKRRTKAVQATGAPPEAVLNSIEELEAYTSPPKRHQNGGLSPAARELALAAEAQPRFASADAQGQHGAERPGPLAEGLLAGLSSRAGSGDANFSPLACGLRAPSFTARAGGGFQQPVQQQPQQQPAGNAGADGAAGGDKQRKHLRQAAAFRLAAARRRGVVEGRASIDGAPLPAAPTAAAAAAGTENQQQPSAFSSQPSWQSLPAAPAGQTFCLLVQQGQLAAVPLEQHAEVPQLLQPPAPRATAIAGHLPAQQQHHSHLAEVPDLMLAPHASHSPEQRRQQVAAPSVARHSTGQDMETDLRCSWGSERSADVTGWRELQARLREEADAGLLPSPGAPQLQASLAADGAAGGSAGPCAMLRASADGEGSMRSSLDGPSCSDRQASFLPLRTSARGTRQWPSHMPSPRGDGASPDPLLGSHQGPSSSGNARNRTSRGGSSSGPMKWSCFSCASPFSCSQRPNGDDSDGEVVRRTDSTEGFVIRRKHSSPSPVGPARDCPSGSGRLKRASLNQPPEGEHGELVHRQPGFSAGCSASPCGPCGPPNSPAPPSEAGSDDSFSLPSGPGGRRSMSLSVGLRDASIEELTGGLGGGSEGAPSPSVDALNDMLKALSLCPAAHPKDAEELVAQACHTHAIQPNATTARTLEKMWAVHEQLYG